MPEKVLVLWDIDRTLLYVGTTDRRVYQDAFARVVGRPAERLPARGTGVTMPLAVRELLRANGVTGEAEVERLADRVIELMPELLESRVPEMRQEGQVMVGAEAALRAVWAADALVPGVLTGNLRRSAEIKLGVFSLDGFVDTEVGAYASDDAHRPALVSIAQQRAAAKYGTRFARDNTVIIGDSLEDVRTGLLGGAKVIGVASGTVGARDLADAGADRVVADLLNPRLLLKSIADLTSAARREQKAGDAG
ncbi:haloacid dehalogenase-like hydrolase [Kitasatospora viridis]|uniref:Phosphoglycolate phosphatase-like HAD superfamily hydrolase n=1 Tax=Kitasatospora viridis TaxID=281105 RepID=A0A561TSD3_9ACTN|nr:haloacid dehalogenase-like hydrolase [Kitasatospora viridis]TWF90023.1 phosphoglycolate phosphatase-like HAD superfamily hydrolase [Kitasatospora viridis]